MSDLLADFDIAAAKAPGQGGLLDAFDQAAKPIAGPKTQAAMDKPKGVYEALPESMSPESVAERRKRNAAPGMALQLLTGTGAGIIGGWRGLSSLAGGLAAGDDLQTSLSDAADAADKEIAARTIAPDKGTDAERLMTSQGNPLNWPASIGGMIGGKVADWTGSPALATVADAGSQMLIPLGAAKVARIPISRLGERPALAPRVDSTLTEPSAVSSNPSPSVDFQLAPQEPVPARAEPLPAQPVTAKAPKPTFSDPAAGVYAEEAPDKPGGVSTADQQRREDVLKQIGLDQVRRSAISGDANQAAVDFQISRVRGAPDADVMSQQLSQEKQAVTNYAQRISQETGGSSLNDEAGKHARGEAILTPIEALKEWYDNQTSSLYKVADERAQGVPTQLDTFRTVLGDDSLATNSDRVHLRAAIKSYAKSLGIVGEDGSVFSNAQQAETMRKYLNENWSPQNSGLVGKLKDALDQDVMSAAGEDVYGQARALRAQRAQTLDNPNGIAKILDSLGPNGVNRAVPVEKVSTAVTNLPVAQLGHIVETLKNVPPELQPMAADALSEIKAQFANNIRDIGANQQGQWNTKGVHQFLAANSKRMSTVFSPEEMQKFGTLNDAGNILMKDQSYQGAYAQQQSLVRAGASHAITAGTATAGGAIGSIAGPMGTAAGSGLGAVIGNKIAVGMTDKAAMRNVQKRMVKLSDLVKTTP